MKACVVITALILSIPAFSQSVERFMVVADMHHYSPAADFSQTITYELCLAAIEEQVDFIFFPGDLIIRSSDDNSSLLDWQFVLDTLSYHNIKVYACRGNNDVSSLEAWNTLFSGDYAFPQNGPEGEKNITYAIVYDNLLFLALDQYTDYHKINQVWVEGILLATPREHIFAAGHEAAFKISNACMGDYPEPRNLFWESITSAGVSAYFCGHDHFYDHAIIDDGDDNPGNDVHQVIVGTGGGSSHGDSEFDGDNGRWTPVRVFHEATVGYVLVELVDSEIQMSWKHRTAQYVFEDGGDAYSFLTSINHTFGTAYKDDNLRYYPNPVINQVHLDFKENLPDATTIELMDINGNILSINRPEAGQTFYTLDLSSFSKGVYFIKINSAKCTITEKVIKIE